MVYGNEDNNFGVTNDKEETKLVIFSMNEKLLQFIWQFQYYNLHELRTTSGLPLTIIHHGTYNTSQGPDFLNARIRVAQTTWVGNIELHVKATDWKSHRHSRDNNYNNVILHVVWEENRLIDLPFPTLELASRVPTFC